MAFRCSIICWNISHTYYHTILVEIDLRAAGITIIPFAWQQMKSCESNHTTNTTKASVFDPSISETHLTQGPTSSFTWIVITIKTPTQSTKFTLLWLSPSHYIPNVLQSLSSASYTFAHEERDLNFNSVKLIFLQVLLAQMIFLFTTTSRPRNLQSWINVYNCRTLYFNVGSSLYLNLCP